MYTIIKDNGTEQEKANGLHRPNGEKKMKITAKRQGNIGRKSYMATTGNGQCVIVSVYDFAFGLVHVIVSATGADQLEFFAPCFSDAQMWQLLQTWIKAYL